MNAAQRSGAAALLAIACALDGCASQPSSQETARWAAQLQQLQAEQDSLRLRAAELVADDARIQALPAGEVVIAVPTAFLHNVIERLFTDVVNSVTLSISGIKAHVAKSVKKVVKIGDFVVDVEILRVVGKLEPQPPRLVFGADQVSMALPIRLTEGDGEASIHFVWNGKNVADLACGDLDVTQKVTGTVVPSDYLVTGTLSFAITGKKVVATPQFPETKLNVKVAPSQESWRAIHKLLEEKHGVCGWVLDKVNVPSILENLVQTKGFNVKLPLGNVKPFVFPAGVSDSVTVGATVVAFATDTKSMRIDPDAIWYGAAVAMHSAHAAAATAASPEAPVAPSTALEAEPPAASRAVADSAGVR